MLEVTVLGSGSAGNSCLVRCGTTRGLVDAGLRARRLVERMSLCGVAVADLDGILISHEHGDHTGAIGVLAKKHAVPVYANPLTAEAFRFQNGASSEGWKLFATGGEFSIGSMVVQTFSVPHDAADPVGFVIASETARFAVLTDLGTATRSVIERVRHSDGVLVDCNYDERLLDADTKRPWPVKQRIASRHGHLSNSAAAELVANMDTERLKTVILGHLSRDCNSPAHALAAIKGSLDAAGLQEVRLHCAEQENVSPAFEIGHTEAAHLATR